MPRPRTGSRETRRSTASGSGRERGRAARGPGLAVRGPGLAVRGPGLAFVVAEFHEAISEVMLATARAEAERLGARVLDVRSVPGCYETPLVAEALLGRHEVDAVVVLGFIERGETLHGEVMGHVVHRALVEASVRAKKPVGLGIIGPGATPAQAEVRKVASARAAVRAVLRSLEELLAIRRLRLG